MHLKRLHHNKNTSRKLKLGLYGTIRPIITFASETRTLEQWNVKY